MSTTEHEIRDARSVYARYECDHCKSPIGYYGVIRTGLTDAGTRVLLAASCEDCYAKRGRL